MRAEWVAAVVGLLAAAAPASRADDPPGRVVLRWQAIPGAVAYELQVSSDPGFARRQVELRVELAGHRLGPPSAERRWWRVRALDGEGRPGAWSAPKVIEPAARAEAPAEGPPPGAPDPVLLDVPPLRPVVLAAGLAPGDPTPAGGSPGIASPGEEPADPPAPDATVDHGPVLRRLRPGLAVGGRANLLGAFRLGATATVDAPVSALGEPWSASLRVGWWRARAEVRAAGEPVDAVADVLPVALLGVREATLPFARAWVGAGAGADLVVVRVGDRGALEASAALHALVGAGLPLAGGEAFAEVAASIGGVEGPLGRLRTGGVALQVGYRLGR